MDVSNVTNFSSCFSLATKFTGDVEGWDTGSALNMSSMFLRAAVFSRDIGGWDVSNVTNFSNMFNGAAKFNKDISTWDTSSATTMERMFVTGDNNYWSGQSGVYGISFDQDIGPKVCRRQNAVAADTEYTSWNISGVTTLKETFAGHLQNSASYARNIFNNGGSNSIQYWDTSGLGANGLYRTFYRNKAFNQPLTSQLVTYTNLPDYTSWDVSSVETFTQTFAYASAFNQDLDSWDTSGATGFNATFQEADAFDGSLSGWDVSNVTDFTSMFSGADSFTGKGLSTWNINTTATDDVDMNNMFTQADSFKILDSSDPNYDATVDISGWDVSRVSNMNSMFYRADTFNQDLSGWNTGNCTNMTSMFNEALAFDADLGSWDLSSIPDGDGGTSTAANKMIFMLRNCGISAANLSATLVGWEASVAAGNGPINMWHRQLPITYANLTTAGQTAYDSLVNNHGWNFS